MPHTQIRLVARHPYAHLELYVVAILIMAATPWFGWALLALGLFVLMIGEIARRSHALILYEDGILQRYRLLSITQSFVEYHAIQGVELTQTFVERSLGIGTIHIDTAGGDRKEIIFHGVKDPHEVENIIREHMREMPVSLNSHLSSPSPAVPAAKPAPRHFIDSDPS